MPRSPISTSCLQFEHPIADTIQCVHIKHEASGAETVARSMSEIGNFVIGLQMGMALAAAQSGVDK